MIDAGKEKFEPRIGPVADDNRKAEFIGNQLSGYGFSRTLCAVEQYTDITLGFLFVVGV